MSDFMKHLYGSFDTVDSEDIDDDGNMTSEAVCEVRAIDVIAAIDRINELEAENAKLQRDAERFRYIRNYMTNANSLHMDGTSHYRLRSPRARARSFEEAIDIDMKGGEACES